MYISRWTSLEQKPCFATNFHAEEATKHLEFHCDQPAVTISEICTGCKNLHVDPRCWTCRGIGSREVAPVAKASRIKGRGHSNGERSTSPDHLADPSPEAPNTIARDITYTGHFSPFRR